MPADLADLIHNDTAEMAIKDHQGKPLMGDKDEMSIEFFGPDSDEQLQAYRKHRKNLIAAGGDSEAELKSECEFLSEVTYRFNNVIYNGKNATKKSATKIYRDIVMIRAQASMFVGSDVNFIKSEAQN